MTLYLYRCLQSYMICSIFLTTKKIRKATFLLSLYWHPLPNCSSPTALHRTLVFQHYTLHGHVYNYTRLCGILLSFLRLSSPSHFFFILNFFSLFRLLIASLSPSLPYSLFDDHVFSDGHECVSRSRQDLRGSVDTNNVHLTIVAVSF